MIILGAVQLRNKKKKKIIELHGCEAGLFYWWYVGSLDVFDIGASQPLNIDLRHWISC